MDNAPWSAIQTPPAYSPAIDTPHYTREPREDEERVQISGRLPVTRDQSGVFVEKTKHVTLALTNQIQNCKEPTYGKGSVVQGALSPVKPEGIVSVELKLEAVFETTMSSVVLSGDTFIQLFSKEETLYEKPEPTALADSKRPSFTLSRKPSRPRSSHSTQAIEGDRCPSTLVFAIRFPTVYTYEGVSRALPPSYSDHFSGVPGLNLNSRYTISITINRKGPLGMDKKTVLVKPIIYLPRSRPAQPALPPSLSFLSTLKSSPEEWKLFEAESATRDGHNGAAVISSGLLLPRVQVFPVSHAIPFHLQLSCTSAKTLAQYALAATYPQATRSSARSHSLMNFAATSSSMNTRPLKFSQTPPSRSSRGVEDNSESSTARNADALEVLPDAGAQSADVGTSAGGRIYISVQRHVAVEVMGQWLLLKRTMSTCTFKRCAINDALSDHAGSASLAWEGHIYVAGDCRCGGFGGPGVRVKDYILLSVIPPDPDHAPLQEIHNLIPVRLTTDPYNEDIMVPGMELAHNIS